MDPLDKLLDEAPKRMDKSVKVAADEMKVIRTGQASVSILDGITVEAYGAKVPLNQLAGLAAPDPSLLTVKPYDRSIIGDIQRALQKSELELNPSNDGEIIRLPIPPLSEERRKALVKRVGEIMEQGKTALRNIRREANDAVKALQKEKKISEDQMHTSLNEIQEMLDERVKKLEEIHEAKEKEILEK
ncbi:MAG: ribosome recycling factor [Acidobacteriota bacterium]|nr:MAG: ribosome recycling factor [Acidobacteriota bacterium]